MKKITFLLCLLLLCLFAVANAAVSLPTGASLKADVAYGADPLQKLDVYTPAGVLRAPVIFMVHGGGWTEGDKANHNVIANKVPYFLGKGFVFVSVNYRLSPAVNPLQEAQDVAAALAYFQKNAATYKANADHVVLMGHSAGGNLVTLLASVPKYIEGAGATPVIGTVVLDSAAYDVPSIMAGPHPSLYDAVFAHHPLLQRLASPTLQISGTPAPLLLVCDSGRSNACDQATPFAAKAGSGAAVYPVALTHEDINLDVGLPNALTAHIAQFLAGLKAGS
jgi:arylformamidase